MTNAVTLGPVPAHFDPAKSYRVQLSATIDVRGHKFKRAATHVVAGTFAEAHRDKIVAAREEAF